MGFNLVDNVSFLVACFMGATVRVLRNDRVSLKRKFSEVFSGVVVAYYTASAVVFHWQLDPAMLTTIGFIVGLVSMEVCGVLITVTATMLPHIVGETAKNIWNISRGAKLPRKPTDDTD